MSSFSGSGQPYEKAGSPSRHSGFLYYKAINLGIIPRISPRVAQGITTFVVPDENRFEAEALGKGEVAGMTSLADAVYVLIALFHGKYKKF